MAGAGRAVMRSLGPGHQQALQQFFPILPSVIQAERVKTKNPVSSRDTRSSRRSPLTVDASADGRKSSPKYNDGEAAMKFDGREPARCSSVDHVTQMADGNTKVAAAVEGRVAMTNENGSTTNSKSTQPLTAHGSILVSRDYVDLTVNYL